MTSTPPPAYNETIAENVHVAPMVTIRAEPLALVSAGASNARGAPAAGCRARLRKGMLWVVMILVLSSLSIGIKLITDRGGTVEDGSPCGKVQRLPRVRDIHYNHHPQQGNWPWHVLITRKTGLSFGSDVICSGAFFRRKRVITSASCAKKFQTNPQELQVHMGSIYLSERHSEDHHGQGMYGRIIITVVHIDIQPDNMQQYIQPMGNKSLKVGDVAILYLAASELIQAINTKYILPACLGDSTKPVTVPDFDLSICVVTGFGGNQQADGVSMSPVLLNGLMRTSSFRYCDEEYSKLTRSSAVLDHDHFFCATVTYNTIDEILHVSRPRRPCIADRGSPLVCKEERGDTWYLVGISTATVGEDCELNVFARVSAYRRWLRMGA